MTKKQRKEYDKKYRRIHKKKRSIYNKKYWKEHKEEIKKSQKQYRELHKKEQKEYHQKHKKEKQIYDKIHRKEINYKQQYRFKIDINFKLSRYLRNRINMALKRNSKRGHTLELLGCSIEFLKKHLEKQFTKSMSWKNYGKWHIDHIKPCASFDLRKKSEQYKCFNYTNLQPLWAKDNIKKRWEKYHKKI